jgi:hypothetical protein
MEFTKYTNLFKQLKRAAGLFLFIFCSIAIYQQLKEQPNLKDYGRQLGFQFLQIKIYFWVLLFFLMVLNFSIEAIKWKQVLRPTTNITFTKALRAVFLGQAFAFFTPNRVGEYFGRTLQMEKGSKLEAAAKMAWTGLAQLMITLIIGSLAIYVDTSVQVPYLKTLQWLSPLVVIFGLLFYFQKINFKGRWAKLDWLKIPLNSKVQLLFLSLIRYLLFVLQYYVAASMLQIDIPVITLFVAIAIMFYCLSIFPTITITEIAIRGQLILLLLSSVYSNNLQLICLSTLIWVVNFLVPAIIGAFLLLGFKIKE